MLGNCSTTRLKSHHTYLCKPLKMEVEVWRYVQVNVPTPNAWSKVIVWNLLSPSPLKFFQCKKKIRRPNKFIRAWRPHCIMRFDLTHFVELFFCEVYRKHVRKSCLKWWCGWKGRKKDPPATSPKHSLTFRLETVTRFSQPTTFNKCGASENFFIDFFW